jgi:hypothetical protein
VKSGLKGSGDYGMLTFGPYAGQGPNRSDLNGELHWTARLAYPFKLQNGQFLELGLQGYTGRFVPSVEPISVNGVSSTPSLAASGVTDERVGITAVWYPQPFGFETEWNVGRGPQLSRDFTSIGEETLLGGFVGVNYRMQADWGTFFPFVRWHLFDGARKFARNAPGDQVNEIDAGFEWLPWPELELSLMYTHTLERTNTRDYPYLTLEDADRLSLQLQWNS